MGWEASIIGLQSDHVARLAALPVVSLHKGSVLFRYGDAAQGFPVVLDGRIEVFLTGPTGREILLYAVEPGQSCVQTTLGLMGDEDYAAEAVTATDCKLVLIPRSLFATLMDRDQGFRRYVLTTFARRMQEVTRLLERVAFGRIEVRLAATLLDLAQSGEVHATQAELAARIGSAREVVARQLEAFTRAGWIARDRGEVHLRDPGALRRLAAGEV